MLRSFAIMSPIAPSQYGEDKSRSGLQAFRERQLTFLEQPRVYSHPQINQ